MFVCVTERFGADGGEVTTFFLFFLNGLNGGFLNLSSDSYDKLLRSTLGSFCTDR